MPDVIIVSGAGTTAVNGTYRRCDFSGEASPKYIMENGEWNGDVCDFSLQLCKMLSTNWTWFISIADVEQPGTDRDIDFYCSTTNPTMMQTLPLSGWRVKQHGRAPLPSFKFVYDKH